MSTSESDGREPNPVGHLHPVRRLGLVPALVEAPDVIVDVGGPDAERWPQVVPLRGSRPPMEPFELFGIAGRRPRPERVPGPAALRSRAEYAVALRQMRPAPASPVDPAALLGELVAMGLRVATSATLLPLRLTSASVRAARSAFAPPRPPVRHLR